MGVDGLASLVHHPLLLRASVGGDIRKKLLHDKTFAIWSILILIGRIPPLSISCNGANLNDNWASCEPYLICHFCITLAFDTRYSFSTKLKITITIIDDEAESKLIGELAGKHTLPRFLFNDGGIMQKHSPLPTATPVQLDKLHCFDTLIKKIPTAHKALHNKNTPKSYSCSAMLHNYRMQFNVGLYKYANPPPSIIWSTSPFETVNRGHTNNSLMPMMMIVHQNGWFCSFSWKHCLNQQGK